MKRLKKFEYLSYIGPLWIVGLFMSKNKTLRYHVNQGMFLMFFEIAVFFAYFKLDTIAYAGDLISAIFGFIFFPVCVLYILVGIFNVLRDRTSPLPYIGFIKIIR